MTDVGTDLGDLPPYAKSLVAIPGKKKESDDNVQGVGNLLHPGLMKTYTSSKFSLPGYVYRCTNDEQHK